MNNTITSIGNASLIFKENDIPILVTDPWVGDEDPAYFGSWITSHEIPCDAISFSPEKFRWCVKSKYYDEEAIKFAIDDAPKHAEDYAKHGIKCLVPLKSYNEDLNHENIYHFNSYSDACTILSTAGLLKE